MHTKTYTQLAQKEREKIYQLKRRGLANSDIAEKLGRDESTIGRELKRNQHLKLKQYLPDTAERKAEKRKTKGRKVRYVVQQPALKKKIIRLLQKGWSPDLIAGRLKKKRQPYLNQESICQYIYRLEGRKQNLRQYLRRALGMAADPGALRHGRTAGIPHPHGIRQNYSHHQ